MRNIRKLIFLVVFLIAAGTLLYSGHEIVSVLAERAVSKRANDSLADHAVSAAKVEDSETSRKETPAAKETGIKTETEVPRETAPIEVDFVYLKEINEEIVGWIYCEDTPINYPIVQSADNSYYLYRLYDGTDNPGGSLFLDFRNKSDFSDWNSIVYGHNMQNDSMFGCLEEYKDQAYYDKHPVMYLLTPEKRYKVELVSGVVIMADADVYMLPIEEEEKEGLIQSWLAHSTFLSETEILPEDNFLVLSTCSYEYDNARYAVIGALRELDTQ